MDRWSREYLRRQEMLATLQTPLLSEAKLTAGLPLSLIVFEESHQDLRVDFGLAPYLEGPRGDLWTSPSDLLVGKVALKPPLTQKHIQALTHEGILEIGAEVEQKFLNEVRLEREKAVANHEEHLRRLFASDMEETIKTLKTEENMRHSAEINELRNYFDNKTCELLWGCYEQVRGLEEQRKVDYDSLNSSWKDQLQREVQETVHRITEEFLEKMRIQEQTLVEIFNKQIENIKQKKKCAVELERKKGKELLTAMTHKLHCQNVANLMYLICKERRKCKSEKLQMRTNYDYNLSKSATIAATTAKQMEKLKRLHTKTTKQLNVRERCLIEVLRQFQKFIYYALKAAPTQGEFLLNINKLIKFELHDFCLKEYEERLLEGDELIVDFMAHEAADAHKSEEEEILEIFKFPPPEEQREPSDALPAFYFNDKMYVREDFRDMVSAGIDIDSKHALWNPDVEELMRIFKEAVQSRKECHIDKIKSHSSNVRFGKEQDSSIQSTEPNLNPSAPTDDKNLGECESTQIRTVLPEPTSSVDHLSSPRLPETRSAHSQTDESAIISIKKLSSMDDTTNERELRKVSLGGESIPSTHEGKKPRKLSLLRRERSPSIQRNDDAGSIKKDQPPTPGTHSKIMLAKDSVIIHISSIERKSLQNIKTTEENASRVSEEKDSSVIKPAIPATLPDDTESERIQILSQKSLDLEKEGSGSQHTSRLLLATDSIELIKSNLGLPTDKKTSKTSPKATQKKQGKHTPTHKTAKFGTASAVKVVGSRKTKEHEKPVDEFTDERIKSLVNIMKENPSLIRLFTPCHK